MFDDERNEEENEHQSERALDPQTRAREKCDEFRMHAELVAVFEGGRKFEADFVDLDRDTAREVQRAMAKLEKGRMGETPVVEPELAGEAIGVLAFAKSKELSTNDYHVHRRPGELMVCRWLAGDQVETFYERMQAHFDAALGQYRQEQRQQHEWKQDEQTIKYLDFLDKLEVKMADRYLRGPIREHGICVLSTQTADEIDILYLCDYVMGVDAYKVVGESSAPPEEGATERDRAWFFKLFSLRGLDEAQERMCFFAYLQKAEDTFGDEW